MKITITLPDTAPRVWRPSQVRILAHEYGVARAPEPTDNPDGRLVRRHIDDRRSHGHGRVILLADLRKYLAYRWYGVWRRVEKREVQPWVDERLSELLNAPDNGLIVVEIPGRCICRPR